jgi:hypothetical protein
MSGKRLSQVLFAIVTVIIAVMSSGLASLSSSPTVYASALTTHHALPNGPDRGRFTPPIHVPIAKPTTWVAPKAHSVAPKAAASRPTLPASVAVGLPKGRKPGEQPDLRTATSSTILNDNGSWTLDSYAIPVNYQDAQGQWEPINTAIIGDAADAGYSYSNDANSWYVYFAAQASASKLLDAHLPGLDYSEALSGAASVSAGVSGSTLTYPTILPHVDAIYTMMHTHMEETYLLHSAQAPASFTLTYHVVGATAQQDAQGDIIFSDSSGATILTIGAPIMFESDAQGQMTPDGQSGPVSMTLSGQGPDYSVTLTPDAQWLADPSRTFPVAIDPTYSSSDPHTNSSNGNIYADTFNESANPTTTFYTTNSERVGGCNALPSGVTGYNTGTNRSYLKFPVNPAPSGNIRVTSANLALWQTTAYAGATTMDVEEIQSAWNATTLDWNNRPTGNPVKASATTLTSYNATSTSMCRRSSMTGGRRASPTMASRCASITRVWPAISSPRMTMARTCPR